MAKEFKDDSKKAVNLNLEESQIEFLESLKNRSKYVRWLINNDAKYQKFIKERKE